MPSIYDEQKYEKSKKKKNQLKITIFTIVKYHCTCILHGRVSLMVGYVMHLIKAIGVVLFCFLQRLSWL